MLDKQLFLKDLKELRDLQKKSVDGSKTDKEENYRTGSLITLESVIKFIETGAYDKE